jgi:hypothetical protein
MWLVRSLHRVVGQSEAHHGGSGKIKEHGATLRNVLTVARKVTRLTNVVKHAKLGDFVIIAALLSI